MSDFDKDIRAEVLAANAEVNAEAIAARPVKNLAKRRDRPQKAEAWLTSLQTDRRRNQTV